MSEVKPMMIDVEALKVHSTDGKEYQIGDKYQVPESAVANLQHLGMAIPVDRVARAKKAAKASKPAVKKVAKPKAAPRRVGKHKS